MEEVNRWHLENFNPRSREGSDDEDHGCERQGVVDFNPRSREGSDTLVDPTKAVSDISIHAPVKGATFHHARRHVLRLVFQSTLP